MTIRPLEVEPYWGGPSQALRRMVGVWKLERQAGEVGVMVGEASFTAQDDLALLYRERGILRLTTGKVLNPYCMYLYRAEPEGFSVYFDEAASRLFHTTSLRWSGGSLVGEAYHYCGADHYMTQYGLLADGKFEIRHVVKGPRKDYALHSRYTRQA